MLEKFNTDIVYYGGVNPYVSISDNEYDIYLEFAHLAYFCNLVMVFLLY